MKNHILLTKLKLKQLYQLSRILRIENYINYKKQQLINLINIELLKKLQYKELVKICIDLKIKNFKKKHKSTLNNLIYNRINKLNKINLISYYYFNRQVKSTYVNNLTNKTTKSFKYSNKGLNSNNESFGITCEYVLCKLYNLQNNLDNRIHEYEIDKLTNILQEFKKEFKNKHKLVCHEFIGYQNSNIDFNCIENKKNNIQTLSLKSNINSNQLVCPQYIGQCTLNSFINKITKFPKFKKIKLKSKLDIKKFIFNNIFELFHIYYNNLFCCNYLLWIQKNNNSNISYELIEKPIKIRLIRSNFNFTKSIKYWKESNTLKYNNLSIGVFQIHNNRNCIKFRFYFKNLMHLIKQKK